MIRTTAAIVALLLAAACGQDSPPKPGQQSSPPVATTPFSAKEQLRELARDNATVVGYLYVAEQPSVIASFSDGRLLWRTDPKAVPVAQGPAVHFAEPDKACIGFEQNNPVTPSHGLERYLVCEAVQPIKHSNSLPRSQDFLLKPGTLFLQYQPPAGTGFPQYYYATRSK
jgi:hypothetical protein